jgi:hypothetical protein
MRIKALTITTMAAATLLLGACASTGMDTSSGASRTASASSAGGTYGSGSASTSMEPPGGTTASAGAAADGSSRVASAAATSRTFDCEDGRSFVATYDDPAYNGATSIAMQARAAGAAPSQNLQVSLGEDTATLTDGGATINCKART